jgi:hypothetical protein
LKALAFLCFQIDQAVRSTSVSKPLMSLVAIKALAAHHHSCRSQPCRVSLVKAWSSKELAPARLFQLTSPLSPTREPRACAPSARLLGKTVNMQYHNLSIQLFYLGIYDVIITTINDIMQHHRGAQAKLWFAWARWGISSRRAVISQVMGLQK